MLLENLKRIQLSLKSPQTSKYLCARTSQYWSPMKSSWEMPRGHLVRKGGSYFSNQPPWKEMQADSCRSCLKSGSYKLKESSLIVLVTSVPGINNVCGFLQKNCSFRITQNSTIIGVKVILFYL